MINAIYLANQQQTAESLLMIIIYIYTHYVHAASSLRTAPLPSPPACAPAWESPQAPPAPNLRSRFLNVHLCPPLYCLPKWVACDKKGLIFPEIELMSRKKVISRVMFTAQVKLQEAPGAAGRCSPDSKDWTYNKVLGARLTAAI